MWRAFERHAVLALPLLDAVQLFGQKPGKWRCFGVGSTFSPNVGNFFAKLQARSVEELNPDVNHGDGQRGVRAQPQPEIVQRFPHGLELFTWQLEQGL